jgi:hypothetical protein
MHGAFMVCRESGNSVGRLANSTPPGVDPLGSPGPPDSAERLRPEPLFFLTVGRTMKFAARGVGRQTFVPVRRK